MLQRKVKVKLFLSLTKYHAMKTYPLLAPRHEEISGSGGRAPRILSLGIRHRRMANFKLQPLYTLGESPLHPLDRTLGAPRSRFGHGGENNKSQLLPGIELWSLNS